MGPDFSPSGLRLKHRSAAPASSAKPGKRIKFHELASPNDSTDPYIVNLATTLNKDPSQIFAYVRDKIGYEAYSGSLRGARGTLWSLAGNVLDRASLLVALFRASGITARYVQGTLSQTQAQAPILEIFNGRYRLLGCLPPGTTASNPAADASLLGIAENHFWVEYSTDNGNTYIEADPTFANSQLGQSYGTPTGNFTQIPYYLLNTISFELNAEMYSQAGAALSGSGFSTTSVLSEGFPMAELVGMPVTIGQFVTSSNISSLLSSTTNIYSPYLNIGIDPSDPSDDQIYPGTDFQEVLTNFPLGSQVLTGLFLIVTVTDSSGNSQTFNKTLYDAIGFAARLSGSTQISVSAGQGPALNPLDLTTINVLPSRQDNSIVTTWSQVNDSLTAQLNGIVSQLPASPNANPTPAQTELQQQAMDVGTQLAVNTERILTANFAYLSDLTSDAMANILTVNEYPSSPRLIVATTFIHTNANSTQTT